MARKRKKPDFSKLPPDMLAYFKEQGSSGGKTSSANMTPEQRSARARKAVAAREAKRQAADPTSDTPPNQ